MGDGRCVDNGAWAVAELAVGEILKGAQTRWLRPLEVYDILSNYQQYNFKLNKEAPVLPKSERLPPCQTSLRRIAPFSVAAGSGMRG